MYSFGSNIITTGYAWGMVYLVIVKMVRPSKILWGVNLRIETRIMTISLIFTYIKSGSKWWIRAQKAIPFLQLVVKLVTFTPWYDLVISLHHSNKSCPTHTLSIREKLCKTTASYLVLLVSAELWAYHCCLSILVALILSLRSSGQSPLLVYKLADY